MKFIILFMCLFCSPIYGKDNNLSYKWKIVVNENCKLVPEKITKVQLYKIFSCESKMNVLFLDVTEDNKQREIYNQFLQLVLDDSDMNFIKFKSKNITRIRKREANIIKFYDNEEDIIKKISEDETSIGIIVTSNIPSNFRICEIKND